MQPRAHRFSFTLLLIGALVLRRTLLALLQYRWLGQISVAERQTMAINLRNQARGLQEEFTQEIERACNRLRVSREGFREHGWDELIERYARWKAGAAFPGLIKNLFVARAIGDGQFELKKLNEQANRFGACEWPANFSAIPRRFGVARRTSGNELPRREKERAEEERGLGSIIEHGYVLEEIPAVVRFGVEIERMEKPRSPEER